MDDNGRFGFNPEDLDRVIRDASEGLREAVEGVSRFFTAPTITAVVAPNPNIPQRNV